MSNEDSSGVRVVLSAPQLAAVPARMPYYILTAYLIE